VHGESVNDRRRDRGGLLQIVFKSGNERAKPLVFLLVSVNFAEHDDVVRFESAHHRIGRVL
jgi:hypothetical protein